VQCHTNSHQKYLGKWRIIVSTIASFSSVAWIEAGFQFRELNASATTGAV
jgi:hypothetical protein